MRWWLAGGAAALAGAGLLTASLGTQAQEAPVYDPVQMRREAAQQWATDLHTASGGRHEPGNRTWEQIFQIFGGTSGVPVPVQANRPLTAADRELGLQTPGHTWGGGYGWSEVVMDNSTGAECMDGSNYKIYTKLSPATTNLMILMEPGGACFDHGTCTGSKPQFNANGAPKIVSYIKRTMGEYNPLKDDWDYTEESRTTREIKQESPLARNPNGIVPSYLNILQSGKTATLNSPLTQKSFLTELAANDLIRRLGLMPLLANNLFESRRFKMEDWNIVFFPYCTADMHAGNATNVYSRQSDDEVSDPFAVVRHKGLKNVQAGLSIIRDRMPQPAQVLFAGQSAGGAAVDFLRPYVSHVLAPTDKFYAFADGVPLGKEVGKVAKPHVYTAPYATEADYANHPSTGLLTAVRVKHWAHPTSQIVNGQVVPVSPLTNVPATSPLALMKKVVDDRLAARGVAASVNVANLSDYGRLVSMAFPDDRMLYIMSQSDQTIPSYIYAHNPGRDAAAIRDGNINSTFPPGHKSYLAEYHRSVWGVDLRGLKNRVALQNRNVGYFMPSGRMLVKSHVLTGLNYEGSVNYDTGTTVVNAMDNLMDRNHPYVMREMEDNNRKGLFVNYNQPKTRNLHKLYMHFTDPRLVSNGNSIADSIFGQGTVTMLNRIATLPSMLANPVPMTPHRNGEFGVFELAMGSGGGVDSQMPVATASGTGTSSGTTVGVSAGPASEEGSLKGNAGAGGVSRSGPRSGGGVALGTAVRAVKSR